MIYKTARDFHYDNSDITLPDLDHNDTFNAKPTGPNFANDPSLHNYTDDITIGTRLNEMGAPITPRRVGTIFSRRLGTTIPVYAKQHESSGHAMSRVRARHL